MSSFAVGIFCPLSAIFCRAHLYVEVCPLISDIWRAEARDSPQNKLGSCSTKTRSFLLAGRRVRRACRRSLNDVVGAACKRLTWPPGAT